MVASLNSCKTALEVQADLKSSVKLEMSSVKLEMRFHLLRVYSLPGMALDPGALPVERDLTAFPTSSTVGELVRLALITTCWRCAMVSSLMEEGWLSTLWKCLAHLPRIFPCLPAK